MPDPYSERSRRRAALYAVADLALVAAVVAPAVVLVGSITVLEGIVVGLFAWFVGLAVLLSDLLVAAVRSALGSGQRETDAGGAGRTREG